ncbi:uncharacterized protein LOC127263835 [Andrographis paniculata]|uniref:uncharacterized protein LOC127263835 n=1 Tax=Andrographis paniculata TaxID=175694 RepID=UPI0021E7834F|nr:uncharacterized protein LOC127263835 [Andrographis paniculata]
MDDTRALPEDEWFCRVECKRIHSPLRKFVSDCDMELPETVVEILKKKVKGKASKPSPNYSNMKWRILKPNSNSEDNRAWLSNVKTILELSATEFEEHDGYGHRRKRYTNICTSKNESLEELSSRLQAAQTIAGSALCSKCHDGGDLLLCKECRHSFHTECVHLSTTKDNKQICEYCKDMLREKQDTVDDAPAALPTAKSLEAATPSSSGSDDHCEDDLYKCFLCRGNSFSKKNLR